MRLHPIPALHLRRKRPSRLIWGVWLGFNGLGLAVLLTALRYPYSLYVRNALFTQVFDTGQLPSEERLNALLETSLRYDPPQLQVRSLFTPAELAKLDGLQRASQAADCRVPTDHPRTQITAADCLARGLAKDVSPYRMGGSCGLDLSIRSRIGSVRNGVGCCSDYNEAFLLRAQALGLQVREVHNLGHTTAEYFDPAEQRWKWIDTSLRVQFSNEDGQLKSAWQRSARFPWRRINLVDLPPFAKIQKFDKSDFEPYVSASNAVLFWTRGLNFLQQENFEAPLRHVGMPREVIQLASLSLGVRPGWILVAPAEVAFRHRLSAWLLRGSLLLFVLGNVVLLLLAMGWRVTRGNQAR